MQSEYNLTMQLRPFVERGWKILVRIDKLWEVYQLANTASTSLSLILIDKKGDMIHASVPSDLFGKYSEQLKGHAVVALSNFMVESRDKTYCPLNRPYKIKFTADTKVEHQHDAEIFPKTNFSFTGFNNLREKVGQTVELIDIAGLFVKAEKIRDKLKTRPGESGGRDIVVRNESGDEMKIAFWGRTLELLLPLLQTEEQKTVVIITSLAARSFNGGTNNAVYLQATYGTKIYIDFEIPQAAALINSHPKISSKEQLLEGEKTVQEILDFAEETTEPFRANCFATICKVYTDKGFYYDACRTCKAGVSRDFDTYQCYNCKKQMDVPTARLRVRFQIEDETAQKDVTALEENAQNLTGKSLDDFMDLSVEFAGDVAVKQALEQMLGQKLKFEINVANFNLERPDLPFTVSNFDEWSDPNAKRMRREESS